MSKLSEFDADLSTFKSQVQAKIKANKGGDTWVKIQTLANTVVACETLVDQLAATQKTTDSTKRGKLVAEKLKALRDKFNGVDLKPISLYIKNHGAGGSKTRGILSTAKTKADEKARVALAVEFLSQYGLMQIQLSQFADGAKIF